MGERFSTVLFVEGIPTGDGRQALPDSIVWADPPLPLTWERQSAHSGQAMAEGAIPVGTILTIERVGNQILGTGVLFDVSEVEEIEDLLPLLRVPEGMTRCSLGVSVELDDVTATVDVIEEDSEGFPIDAMETIEAARLRAATIVTTPAFVECTITLLGESAPEMVGDQVTNDAPALAAALAAAAGPDHTDGAMLALYPPADLAASLAVADGLPADDMHVTVCFLGDSAAIPDPEGLRRAVASAAGRLNPVTATISGVGRFATDDGDALYASVDIPSAHALWEALADAARAAGVEPAGGHGWTPHMTLSYLAATDDSPVARLDVTPLTFGAVSVVIGGQRDDFPLGVPALVASATPVRADAFRNPGLTVPTALTITDDGRVFGHLYDSPDQCHLSFAGQCVTPPDEHDLSQFHRGQALGLDDGSEVIPGRLTFHGGHADLNLPAREAKRFYDDPTLPGATVVAGYDPELGLTWFSGLIDPDVTEAQVAKFRSIGQVSGDWRPSDDGTHLNLIAVGLVPVPGFPVRRTRVADGRLTALVAAGPRPLTDADRIARLESAVAALTASAAGTDAVARLMASAAADNLRALARS